MQLKQRAAFGEGGVAATEQASVLPQVANGHSVVVQPTEKGNETQLSFTEATIMISFARYARENPIANIVPIPGTKCRKYLEENLGAVELTLSAQKLGQLEAAFPVGAALGTRIRKQ